MGETRRRRRRKHRGTPAGTVERKRGQPAARQRTPGLGSRRPGDRLLQPPSWRQSATRAAIAAVIVAVVFVLIGRPPLVAAALAGFMFLIYVPLGYATDRALWRWRARRLGAPRRGRDGLGKG